MFKWTHVKFDTLIHCCYWAIICGLPRYDVLLFSGVTVQKQYNFQRASALLKKGQWRYWHDNNNDDNIALHQQTPLGAEAKDNLLPLHESNSNDVKDIEAKGNNKYQDYSESVKGTTLTGDEMKPAS